MTDIPLVTLRKTADGSGYTHLSPQQQRIFSAAYEVAKEYDATYGGEVSSDSIDALRAVLKELSDPATTDWTQERIHAPNNSTEFISAARHLVAMVDETQRYDMDMVCGHELKEANNNVRRLLPYEQAICAPADCAATIKVTIT